MCLHKPSMMILRPDWIEGIYSAKDAFILIAGADKSLTSRASLKRYKRTFPALEAWNSSSQESDLAVGIAAYESTKVLALAPPELAVEQSVESGYSHSADDRADSVNLYSPATPAPRKRNLPTTVKRTKKREAKTADLKFYEGYFGFSDSEDDGHNFSQDTVELSPRHQFVKSLSSAPTTSLKRRHAQLQDLRAQDHKLDAAGYLENILSKLDKESKELLSGNNAQLRLVDIASTDIRLKLRKGR
ncbi:hypothetical protein EC968_006063 [Mortierella alpina]|nr:hypothetical protein EC968_006063 [Mortierella alpina]